MRRREFVARLASCCGAGAALLGALPLAERFWSPSRKAKPLSELTCADFAPAVGSRFRMVTSSGERIWMTLHKAEERTRRSPRDQTATSGPQRLPFSLVFKAAGDCRLGHDTCFVEHSRLGGFAMFLAAVGAPRPGVSTFEAVFG